MAMVLLKLVQKKLLICDAVLRFIKFFYSEEEVIHRLRNDADFTSPNIKNFKVPDDLPPLTKQKIAFEYKTGNKVTEVIDMFLPGAPNDALNAGMQRIVSGLANPEEVAAAVERLIKR
jgi:raffinose/stachyose/melibiose transport system substrate-binding protein